jgi:hypothetical protein
VLNAGDTPGASQHFSQRNLAIHGIGNPGSDAARTVYHPFYIRGPRQHLAGPAGPLEGGEQPGTAPDELLIHWGRLPAATRVTMAFSGVAADAVLELERARGGGGRLSRMDADTIACAVGGATYVAIPPVDHDIAAMITLELPVGVRAGERYGALVQQIGGPERAVLGAFEIDIPVAKEPTLLLSEQRTLAVHRYAQQRRRRTDRWTPILRRYGDGLAARVDAFGGAAPLVRPSLDGYRRRGGCLLALFGLWRALRRR